MHIEKLISELARLYLAAGTISPALLEQQLGGRPAPATTLATGDRRTRAIVIPFRAIAGGDPTQHWTHLCEVANALQAQLGLPAPAVSVSGADGYCLWLSLETPVPLAQAQQFLELLCAAYCPGVELAPDAASAPVELPPCLNQGTGRWAAFIHPGMGASFAEEAGLEMAPPLAGQVGFLEGLHSISDAQFLHACDVLQQASAVAPAASAPAMEASQDAGSLLLRDATLEDIVKHLHAKNIEPTFRHVIAR